MIFVGIFCLFSLLFLQTRPSLYPILLKKIRSTRNFFFCYACILILFVYFFFLVHLFSSFLYTYHLFLLAILYLSFAFAIYMYWHIVTHLLQLHKYYLYDVTMFYLCHNIWPSYQSTLVLFCCKTSSGAFIIPCVVHINILNFFSRRKSKTSLRFTTSLRPLQFMEAILTIFENYKGTSRKFTKNKMRRLTDKPICSIDSQQTKKQK